MSRVEHFGAGVGDARPDYGIHEVQRGPSDGPYGHLGPVTGLVDVDTMHAYREYDRRPPQDLVDDVKANGIREPLVMHYSKGEGNAMLVEGNHRLAAARLAGLTHVPVRVERRSGPVNRNSVLSHEPLPVPVGKREGYVPADLHPRQLGLKVKD